MDLIDIEKTQKKVSRYWKVEIKKEENNINNDEYIFEDLNNFYNKEKLRYVIFFIKSCKKIENLKHYCIYLIFRTNQTLGKIKEFFVGFNLQIQNIKVSESKKFYNMTVDNKILLYKKEYGIRNCQGMTKNLSKKRKSENNQISNNNNNIKDSSLQEIKISNEKTNFFRKVKVFLFIGDSLTGKTSFVLNNFYQYGLVHIYDYNDPLKKYNNEPILLIDNYDWSSKNVLIDILQLLDGYKINIPGNNQQYGWDYVFLILKTYPGSFDPIEWIQSQANPNKDSFFKKLNRILYFPIAETTGSILTEIKNEILKRYQINESEKNNTIFVSFETSNNKKSKGIEYIDSNKISVDEIIYEVQTLENRINNVDFEKIQE